MFESKTYTYEKMFNMIRNEVSSYKEVPDDIMLLACNTELQYLYAQVIKKQIMTKGHVSDATAGVAKQITMETNVPFEDIERICANGENFMKTTARRAGAYNNTYYENENGTVSVITNEDFDGAVEVYYNFRPEEVDSVSSKENVALPTEYIPMLMCAIRTECYKYINEDNLAAKWTNDYNSYRDGFDSWVESRRPQFG